MRIILVHGINNEEHSPEEIKDQWLSAIHDGWAKLGLSPKPMDDVIVAYYAKELAKAASSQARAVAMGDEAAASQSADVAYEFLRSYQEAAGISDEEIADAAQQSGVSSTAVAAGPPHEGWVIALAVGLEALLPTRGKYLAGAFLKQASVYLDNKSVTLAIDSLVRKQIFPEGVGVPAIVLAHSLGTVVTYRLLTDKPPAGFSTPLFVTMGSPLGLEIVKRRIKRLAAFPKPPIGKWINAVCEDDFVTLNKRLNTGQLGYAGVIHDGNVPNAGEDKHAIVPYLRSPGVALAIHEALG